MKGTVVKFDDKKGFGFIQPDGNGERIFVHAEAVTTAGRLVAGQRVSFQIASSAKGPRAVNVAAEGAPERQQPRNRSSQVSPYWFFGGIALLDTILVMALAMWVFSLSWPWAYLLAINLTTIMLYAYDKAIAGSGALRVPELILHSVEILGGTPAGLVGQYALAHKRAKGSYQLVFWLIFIVQVIVVAALFYTGAI
jgi:cold shock CspA family protein/uncharacterized membrane protein YsdA (DUF1294 family)